MRINVGKFCLNRLVGMAIDVVPPQEHMDTQLQKQ